MSLKQKCQDLKDELHRLKKQAATQPKPPTEHKELEEIVFGKGSTASPSTPPQKKESPKYSMRFVKNSPEYEERDETDNVLPTQALNQNRNIMRQEIKEIKKLSNVPHDYKSFLSKEKDDWVRTQNNIHSSRKLEDDENFLLKKTMLTMGKTQKREYPIQQKKGNLTMKNTNENFADVCNKIYNEKKESNTLKFKELIRQTRVGER